MKAASGNVKLLAFIVCVLVLAPSCIKHHNWWEDSQEPHQGTAAWHPYRQYTADIEAALSILTSTDPAEVSYFRSRGFPVVFVPGMSGRKADTTGSGVIEIPQHFAAQPAQLAVLLSHEIVHEQRHDPFATPTEYPLGGVSCGMGRRKSLTTRICGSPSSSGPGITRCGMFSAGNG